MSSKEDWAWAAGFFDGEGSTTLRQTDPYKQVVLQISQKHIEVLEKFQHITGVGTIIKSKLDVYQYRVGAYAQVQYVIAAMWGYLGAEKRKQAAKGLQAMKTYHQNQRRFGR